MRLIRAIPNPQPSRPHGQTTPSPVAYRLLPPRKEPSHASAPFPSDVHAVYFSADAVKLENQLHKQFTELRLNHANPRREFFATPTQVRDVLATKLGNLLEYTTEPEATQYFQSRHCWP
ncbi:GIY-YIG nuclease family protein [Williamsia sp. 1138]|uniref:GIY-YIG nuclease family protein n=1 Tax=Williamsia sp. 1138 TaxID=1903117 RepID=UPI001FEE4FDA|nr:GIY-YIG nuclease family protein [Williamsia sp. 1138]